MAPAMHVRVVCVATILTLTGCATLASSIVESQPFTNELKAMSAGYTGCLPDNNEVAVISYDTNGHMLWNATCKGKKYLCSTVSTTRSDVSSCAPAVE